MGAVRGAAWGRVMSSAISHSLILAGAGIAALALSWGVERKVKTEQTAVVVTLPARPVEARPSATPPPPKPAVTPGDRDGLARELHRELKRVGCYEGDVSSAWTAQSRRAMKAFTDRVNATLPVDQPDYILLRLLQGHDGRACGAPCPAGQTSTDSGRCVPQAVIAKAPDSAPAPAREPAPESKPETKPRDVVERPAPAIVPTPVPVPRFRAEGNLAPSSPKPDARAMPDLPPDRPSDRERDRPARYAAAPPPQTPMPPEAMRESRPTPRVGVYRDRPRRAYRKPKPPKFMRSFVRSVQRSLAPFGIR